MENQIGMECLSCSADRPSNIGDLLMAGSRKAVQLQIFDTKFYSLGGGLDTKAVYITKLFWYDLFHLMCNGRSGNAIYIWASLLTRNTWGWKINSKGVSRMLWRISYLSKCGVARSLSRSGLYTNSEYLSTTCFLNRPPWSAPCQVDASGDISTSLYRRILMLEMLVDNYGDSSRCT